MAEKVDSHIGGANIQTKPLAQAKSSYRFALNFSTETNEGDLESNNTEESNEEFIDFPFGFIPINATYIGGNKEVVFLVNPKTGVSEIGVINENTQTYKTEVNDENSVDADKLHFSIAKQIDCVHRVRRGCEDTLYWVDDLNKPRYYILQKPENFKNQAGNWISSKFSLQRRYKSYPIFKKIQVLNSGGRIAPGSYSFGIRYVDIGLNPTEVITTTKSEKIFNDSLTREYKKIHGSINSKQDFIAYSNTDKSVLIEFDNLDTEYPYYQVIIIRKNSGDGHTKDAVVSNIIETSNNTFVFTGTNFKTTIGLDEILAVDDIISSAKCIHQSDNELLLGNLKGEKANICALQKYASKIKSDCILAPTKQEDITDGGNSKNPNHEVELGIEYNPGEIYSFSIGYLFEDMTLSPLCHIPGKPLGEEGKVYTPLEYDENHNQLTFPMSTNNFCKDTLYIGNNLCKGGDFWGMDYKGNILEEKNVRHHRFPFRSELHQPLFSQNITSSSNTVYYLEVSIIGALKLPIPCPENSPNCGTDTNLQFKIKVNYKFNGEDKSLIVDISQQQFADGIHNALPITITEITNNYDVNTISNIYVEMTDINGFYQLVNTSSTTYQSYFLYKPTITTTIKTRTITNSVTKESSNLFGIKFSNITLPDEKVIGKKIIGYHIFRNIRNEEDKTILDSAVLIPTTRHNGYVSHGLLNLYGIQGSSEHYAFISPDNKFNNKKWGSFDKIIQEGYYTPISVGLGKINYDDVYDGSTFDKDKDKGIGDDSEDVDNSPTGQGYDGWSLNIVTRDSYLTYTNLDSGFVLEKKDIEDVFYLDALDSRVDNTNNDEIFNIAADNKIGFIKLSSSGVKYIRFATNTILPYVVFYKENRNPYSNFRVRPYVKETENPVFFTGDTSQVTLFSGDAYISSMKYTNTMFWDNIPTKRKGKKSIWKIITGAALVVLGATLVALGTLSEIITLGALTIPNAIVVGVGISIIGGGISYLSSGISVANYNKAYSEAYNLGLRDTIGADWVRMFYEYKDTIPFGFTGNGHKGKDGPSDDTICWLAESLTNLWFESPVNINLRIKYLNDITPTFCDSPNGVQHCNDSEIKTIGISRLDYTDSNSIRRPYSEIENHVARKLTVFDSTREDNKLYLGAPLGEFYFVNPDYYKVNDEKLYFHLPLEYDCCSECSEDFKFRWKWSEISFQEELSDNYKVFLSNNYRDLPGNTGEIMRIFKLGRDIFIHSREALWQTVRNQQERITDQIVSFIGTGERFSIAPRPIENSLTGKSAGLSHQWGLLQTSSGVYFPSVNENKIYHFNGKNLIPVSAVNMKPFFNDNLQSEIGIDYYKLKGERFPYEDNPSNPNGVGIISVFDSKKNRVIFTKKDYKWASMPSSKDFELCMSGEKIVIFNNISKTIKEQNEQGWIYEGVENCKLKFSKEQSATVSSFEQDYSSAPKDFVVVPVFQDTLTDLMDISNLKEKFNNWFEDFSKRYKKGDNTITIVDRDNSGNILTYNSDWISKPLEEVLTINSINQNTNLVLVVFSKDDGDLFSGPFLTIPMSNSSTQTQSYKDAILSFYNQVGSVKSFMGINYILAENNGSSKEYIQHTIGAISGDEIDTYNLKQNPIYSDSEWDIVKDNLETYNPYKLRPNLKNYNWSYIENRTIIAGDNTDSGKNIILNEEVINSDLNPQISKSVSTPIIGGGATIKDITVFKYINGISVDDIEKIDSSFTIALSTESNNKIEWLSFYSFLPNLYMETANNFYSWIYRKGQEKKVIAGSDSPFIGVFVPASEIGTGEDISSSAFRTSTSKTVTSEGNYVKNTIWKHNIKGTYQRFYGDRYQAILEYVSVPSASATLIWNHLQLLTYAQKYVKDINQFVDMRYLTFNKVIFYNNRQCSGLTTLVVKDTNFTNANEEEDYLRQQILNLDNSKIMIDRNEKDWTINDLRDYVINYEKSLFSSKLEDRQDNYFIDKVINTGVIDFNKDWNTLESFRGKYLVVRLIFDNFENVKLSFEFSTEDITPSET